jgi:hypothetical protein
MQSVPPRYGCAFEFNNAHLFLYKFLLGSLPVIIMPTLLMYVWAAGAMTCLTIPGGRPLVILKDLAVGVVLIFTFSLFPRACKHLWKVLAKARAMPFRLREQRNDGWMNSAILDLDYDLPHNSYSYQLVAVGGALPLILLFRLIAPDWHLLAPAAREWQALALLAYAAQFAVTIPLAGERRLFYNAKYPRLIVSPRMLFTVPFSVLLPLVFGVIYYAHLTQSWRAGPAAISRYRDHCRGDLVT